jgi:hypothetical protein
MRLCPRLPWSQVQAIGIYVLVMVNLDDPWHSRPSCDFSGLEVQWAREGMTDQVD